MKYALITGASSGIGELLARRCAKDNISLILVARREEKLKSIAEELKSKHQIDVRVLAKDLSKPNACKEIFDFTIQNKFNVEFVINNAGFGLLGRIDQLSHEMQTEMIELNIRALFELTRYFLPVMRERKSGRILNIGSTAGFQPGPYMATYYATKAFVNSFTEALHEELKGTGVTATLSCPGPTETEFGNTAGAKDFKLLATANMPAEIVAEQAYQAMVAGKRRVIHGFHNNLLARMSEVFPRRLTLKVVKSLNYKAGG